MVAKPQHQIKLQAYGQAGMASNTYKDPEKDRVAVAGETRKAKAASKFTAIKKLRTEDQHVENSYIAMYSTMRSSWLPLRTEYWSSAPRRGVIPSLRWEKQTHQVYTQKEMKAEISRKTTFTYQIHGAFSDRLAQDRACNPALKGVGIRSLRLRPRRSLLTSVA
jgi:hypothetical protein